MITLRVSFGMQMTHSLPRSFLAKPSLVVPKSIPPAVWTGVGGLAIPLWATWPTLAHHASAMPVFQIMTIAFAWAAVTLWKFEGQSPDEDATLVGSFGPPIACAAALLGMNVLFLLAVIYIPPAQANVLSYLWPVMVVAIGSLIRLFSFKFVHAISLLLGFAGVIVVAGEGAIVLSPLGISLAILSGLSWALFTVFRIWQGSCAKPVLAKGCLLAAVLSLLLHVGFETFQMPSLLALFAAVAIGIIPLGLANLCWDVGVRKGNAPLLAAMAYATPLAGLLVLSLFGLATLTLSLLGGAALIILAGLTANR